MRSAYVWAAVFGALGLISPLAATVVGLGTIEQPVNLGPRSDPASVPLGPVAYEANHGYGIHALISESRPCQHGTMSIPGGQELEQNLARAFGISVEPLDSTSVPYAPVVLRVNAWPKPAYSPYSREQVLAATLQCLVRSSGGTPKVPLVIQVVTEDPADQSWAAKFAGNYITRPGDDGVPVDPTPVPGTEIETDAFGVARVVFPGVTAKAAQPARPPVWIPFRLGGESGPDQPTWELLPVWTGDDWEEPLDALGQPYHLFHDLFNPASSFVTQVNALFHSGRWKTWSLKRSPEKSFAFLYFDEVTDGDLAAFLHALVLSVRPTADQPLEVTLRTYGRPVPYFASCLEAGGWETRKEGNDTELTGTFVLDASTGKLLRGTIPRFTLEGYGSGSLRVVGPREEDDTGKLSKELHGSYQWYFMHGMKGGDFEPTAEEIKLGLGEAKEGSMRWEFWHAGYRDAVLEFLDPALLEEPDAVPPPAGDGSGGNELAGHRQAGWRAGHRRGFEIGTRILKERRLELEKVQSEE
jgi:hypothetical protein